MIPFKDSKHFFKYLKVAYKKCQNGRKDFLLVICGKERIGKTELALRIAYCLGKEHFFDKNKNPNVENICFYGKQYIIRMSETEKIILIFDEAGTSMYSRDAMTPETKSINKKLMVCGYKNIFHILCVPDYYSIDTNIRKHRVNALIRVCDEGKFLTYNEKKSKKIGEKRAWLKPTSRGWWAHGDVDEDFKRFEKAYRKAERKYKDQYMMSDYNNPNKIDGRVGHKTHDWRLRLSKNDRYCRVCGLTEKIKHGGKI